MTRSLCLTSLARVPRLAALLLAAGPLLFAADAYASAPSDTPGTWSTVSPMPVELGEVACGVIGTRLFVVGEGSDVTLSYDLTDGTWRSDHAVRERFGNHHAVEVIDNKLYLFGGLSGSSGGKVQIYDPLADTWSFGADMPWGGGSVQTARIGNLVYATGGIVSFSTVRNLAAYDPVADSWTTLPAAPFDQGRNHAATATDGQRLFVLGGRGEGSGGGNWVANGFDTVLIYDPVAQTWESSLDEGSMLAPLPQARGGMGRAIYYAGEFWVFGGETLDGAGANAEGTYDRVDVYDPVANTWRLGPSMPTARHGIFPVLWENRVFIAGGGPVAGFAMSDAVEVLLLDEPGTTVCFGDGSGTPCPCGNESTSPDQGCLHSGGKGISISACGTTSISANDLVVTAKGCPVGNTGIFYAGKTTFALGNPLFDGLQCTGGDVLRFRGQFQTNGTVSDTGLIPQDLFGSFWSAGNTYAIQYFSRDNQTSGSPCGGLANLSPAYVVTMSP